MKYILLILALFMIGCSGVTCNPPYLESAGECCLDQDSNGICDSEQGFEGGSGVNQEDIAQITQEEIARITQEESDRIVEQRIQEIVREKTEEKSELVRTGPTPRPEVHSTKFACDSKNEVNSRGYVILLGLASTADPELDPHVELMQADPKAKFVKIYPQDASVTANEVAKTFLTDLNTWITETPVNELVLFGISAGGVTLANSASQLPTTLPIAIHTIGSPLKGYDLVGFRAQFIGDRTGYLKDISIGFPPYIQPKENVKVHHHKTVVDTTLVGYYCAGLENYCDELKVQNNNIPSSHDYYYPELDHDPIVHEVLPMVARCYNG